jgi:hypothetical protein
VVERKFAAPVVFTDFRLFGERVQPGDGPLKQPIWSATSLELEARSIFSLDVSALSYADPVPVPARRARIEMERDGQQSSHRDVHDAAGGSLHAASPGAHHPWRLE